MSASTLSTFGRLLRRHRLAAGLTQEGLAERSGLSARGIQDIERGVNVAPRAETVRLLAEALGLDGKGLAELIAAARPELAAPSQPAGVQLRLIGLPIPPTALVGREREVAAACALMWRPDRRDGARLLTLTGPGGVGKTRLALAIGAELAGTFADGIAWVDLAPLHDPDLVASTVVQALGLPEAGDQPPSVVLKGALATRQLLLILDNLEHLLPAAPLVAELLAAAPNLAVMVTSRARLRLRGERELPIAPLTVPPPATNDQLPSPERLADSPAVRLFIERAVEVRPEFALLPDNVATIAEICRRLDGLPLAIELAVAWFKVLPPPVLLARLERRLPLLTGGPRDLPARQQTMRDAIDWSHDLLSAKEQVVFRRLAVLTGGFTLEAAEAVAGLGESGDGGDGVVEHAATEPSVLDLAAALGEQSMLRPVKQASDEARFTLLETVREYGLERLAASGEETSVRRAHAAYFLSLAERAEAELTGPDQAVWLERLDTESPNLRAALEWCATEGDVETGMRLADALWSVWEVRGNLREGRRWLERMLDREPRRTALRARVLTGAGALAFDQGDYPAARSFHEESLAIRRELGDRRGIGVSLGNLGNVADHQGNYAAARELHEECLAIMRELEQPISVSIALNNLGQLALRQGDYAAARECHEESLAIASELNDVWGSAVSLNNLGEVALYQDDHATARERLQESLTIMRELQDTRIIAVTLNHLGEVALAQGDDCEAQGLFEESLALGRDVGDQPGIATSLANLAAIMLARSDPAGARTLLVESLSIRRAISDMPGIARCLLGFAGLAWTYDLPERAARLLGAAEALLETMGTVMAPADRAGYDRTSAAVRAALGDDRFAAARIAGATVTLQQAIDDALALLDESASKPI